MSGGRLTAMVQCAGDAQELLQGALAVVQEAEVSEDTSAYRDELDAVTTALAGVARALSAIHRRQIDDERNAQAELDRIHLALERALDLLASTSLESSDAIACRESIARALALVFASGGGSRAGVPPSRSATSPEQPEIEVGDIDPASLSFDDLDGVTPSERAVIRLEWIQGPASTGLPRESLAPASGERRSDARVILEVDVGVVSDSNFYAGLTMDVSTGGLFVATYQLRPVGTKVELSLVLPDGYAITTPGAVRWIREPRSDAPPGMGIAFTGLEPRDLEAIECFCQERQPLYHDTDD